MEELSFINVNTQAVPSGLNLVMFSFQGIGIERASYCIPKYNMACLLLTTDIAIMSNKVPLLSGHFNQSKGVWK